MKFSVNVYGYSPPGDSGRDAYLRARGVGLLAGEQGFDGIGSGNHWLSDPGEEFSLQPVPLLSAIAPDIPGLWVNIAHILPLVQPVRLAEDLATLDTVTDGHTILTAVLGYAQREFDAFGVPRNERRQRFEEICDILHGLWGGETVTTRGHYPLTNAHIQPRPRNGGIPIWVGSEASASLPRVARYGDAWAIATHIDIDELAEKSRHLRSMPEWDKPALGPARIALSRLTYVAATTEKAIEESLPHVKRRGDIYATLGQADEMDRPEDFRNAYSGRDLGQFLIGEPEEVAQRIVEYHDRCAVGWMNFVVLLPGLEWKKVQQCMILLGREVIPRVREILSERSTESESVPSATVQPN